VEPGLDIRMCPLPISRVTDEQTEVLVKNYLAKDKDKIVFII